MSDNQPCPRCGGPLWLRQRNSVQAKYCNRCGSLPYATDVKTGHGVLVDRAGAPIVPSSAVIQPRLL